jgi:hypothetical protein
MGTKLTFNPLTGELNAGDSTSNLGVANLQYPSGLKTLIVDKNRSDSYTADGSLSRPFKTVQAAVNQVASNGDNSASIPYLIDIIGAGTYSETVELGSAAIVNLVIDGCNGSSITTLQSTVNNTTQAALSINNLGIGTLNFTCPTNNGNLGSNQIQLVNCSVSGTITLNNVQNIFFVNSQTIGALNITNVNFGGHINYVGQKNSGDTTFITNNGLNIPAGFLGTFWVVWATEMNGNISIDAGSTLVAYHGAIIGSSNGAKTVTVNGLYRSLASFTRANITVNNGGTYRAEGGASHVATLTVNAGGAYTSTGHYGIAAIEIGGASESTNAILTHKDGHQRSTQTTAPTTTTNANAGTGATSSVAHATDSAGQLTLTTGSLATASGIQTTVNFNKAYNVAPIVVITPANNNASLDSVLRGIFVTSTTAGFSINFSVAETVGTTYTWNYKVIETQ